jgi:hypothetical protein
MVTMTIAMTIGAMMIAAMTTAITTVVAMTGGMAGAIIRMVAAPGMAGMVAMAATIEVGAADAIISP